jgi:GNAT superfamily N-acetyltransferase
MGTPQERVAGSRRPTQFRALVGPRYPVKVTFATLQRMHQALRIRRARADEAPDLAPVLTDLCRRSKAHWGYDTLLLSRWQDDLRISVEDIDRGAVLVAEASERTEDGSPRVVGFARVTPGSGAHLHHPAPARLDDLWVEPGDIGSGVGRALFEAACEVARTLPADQMLIVADPNAEGFYLRMGARRIGEEASEVVDGRRLPILTIDLHRPSRGRSVTSG